MTRAAARRTTRRTKPAVRRVTRRTTRAGQEYRWKRHNGLTIRGNKWYGYGQSKGGGPADRRRSAKPARRIIPRARRIHADDAAFVPRAAILRPFTPAGAEKAHAAADGSGAYQMADRRRSGKHARRVLPRARRHTCRCCRALRPPHASQPSSRSHRLAEAGCAAADCGASITRTWYGVGVGCAAAAARCASAPVSVPESVACG